MPRPLALLALALGLASPGLALAPVDIGLPAHPGAAVENAGGWEVIAGGTDIWGTSDQFTYLCEQKVGDFDVVVRLQSLNPAQLYSRMGLMARAHLDPKSAHLFLAAFSENASRHNNNGGIELQYRESDGGSSAAVYPPSGPVPAACQVYYPHTWLRLKRQGNHFVASTSQDGALWNIYASRTMVLPELLYVGVAVTAHDPEKTTQAHFTDYHELAP